MVYKKNVAKRIIIINIIILSYIYYFILIWIGFQKKKKKKILMINFLQIITYDLTCVKVAQKIYCKELKERGFGLIGLQEAESDLLTKQVICSLQLGDSNP